MRAVRCGGSGIEVQDVPEPTGAGVPVRVAAAGICGSDLHMVSGPFAPKVTLGHEIAGFAPDGTPVAVEPVSICGRCEECRRGDYNLCRDGAAIIHGVGREGGMAEVMLVPESALVPLPKGVEVGNASLVEPIGIAVHGLRIAGLRAGMRVGVVGGGTIGLCAVAALRHAGALPTLYARHEAQREAGARLGASDPADADPEEFELVVEAAGSESAFAQAAQLAAPGASVVMLSTAWDPVQYPGMALALKEVRVVPSSLYGRSGQVRDIEVAARVLAGDPEIPRALVTHRFPLEAAPEAFATAADRASGAIKVVLEP